MQTRAKEDYGNSKILSENANFVKEEPSLVAAWTWLEGKGRFKNLSLIHSPDP